MSKSNLALHRGLAVPAGGRAFLRGAQNYRNYACILKYTAMQKWVYDGDATFAKLL